MLGSENERERYKISDHTIQTIARALEELEKTPMVGREALSHLARLLRQFDDSCVPVMLSDNLIMQPSDLSSSANIELVSSDVEMAPGLLEPMSSPDGDPKEALFHREESSQISPINSDQTDGEISFVPATSQGDLAVATPLSVLAENHAEDIDRSERLVDVHHEVDHVSDEEHTQAKLPCVNHTILIIGGPGSGKGTICERLIADHHFAHLSVGELLRSEVAAQSAVGLQVESIMKAGQLVPDDLVMEIVQSHISHSSSSVLLDGFPRTANQAEQFTVAPSLVLWLECEDQILINRILERAKHSGRQDDNLETVAERIKTFKTNAEPILHYYHGTHSNLVTIDGSGSIEAVYAQVDEAVRKVLNKPHESTV